MTKTLRKAIVKRPKLRNTYNKKRSSENWKNYGWQRNICSNIPKPTKNAFFGNLNINKITDNRKFWKTVGSLFPQTNVRPSSNIILKGKNETLNDNNKKFQRKWQQNISQILWKALICENQQEIKTLKMKKAVKSLKKKFGNKNVSFETVSTKDVLNLIKELPGIKDTVSNDIPVSLLKQYVSTCCKKLTDILISV